MLHAGYLWAGLRLRVRPQPVHRDHRRHANDSCWESARRAAFTGLSTPRLAELVWQTRVGPGGTGGGIQWGSATDGLRIYVAEVNDQSAPWALVPSAITTTGGFFSALDPATGKILWQTADPQGAKDFGYVSVANGVVYAGSGAGSGNTMYALDARHGTVLWSYPSGGSVMGGAAVVDGRVYWASGYYSNNCPPAPTTCGKTYALYSFGLPGA